MRRWLLGLFLLTLLWPAVAGAHLGNPDVFYEGAAGPYPVSVIIRVPSVVPGRARIEVRVSSAQPVTVSFAPISAHTAISNTPPPEMAEPIEGETNAFRGELWLMTSGGYGIDIRVHGPTGDGAVQIPVNSVATQQLPLPSWLGKALAALAIFLFCSGIAIIAAASSESIVPVGDRPGALLRRRYRRAMVITGIVFVVLLVGGRRWWKADEQAFRTRLREGGWPDLDAQVQVMNGDRILHLTLGDFGPRWNDSFDLARDHGKWMHVYLVSQPSGETFAHLHPARMGDRRFDLLLPPLPAGNYEVFCDFTLAAGGQSSTATNMVQLPPVPTGTAGAGDPDDSWTDSGPKIVSDTPNVDTIYRLAGGQQIVWKAHPAEQTGRNADLVFEVRDAAGQPMVLEPYMGMFSHAVVLRADGRVFAHLHPSGNYSMAAQSVFDKKLSRPGAADAVCGPGASALSLATIRLPYEFPTPGKYRVWVQFKTAGKVETARFDTTVNSTASADQTSPGGT